MKAGTKSTFKSSTSIANKDIKVLLQIGHYIEALTLAGKDCYIIKRGKDKQTSIHTGRCFLCHCEPKYIQVSYLRMLAQVDSHSVTHY